MYLYFFLSKIVALAYRPSLFQSISAIHSKPSVLLMLIIGLDMVDIMWPLWVLQYGSNMSLCEGAPAIYSCDTDDHACLAWFIIDSLIFTGVPCESFNFNVLIIRPHHQVPTSALMAAASTLPSAVTSKMTVETVRMNWTVRTSAAFIRLPLVPSWKVLDSHQDILPCRTVNGLSKLLRDIALFFR